MPKREIRDLTPLSIRLTNEQYRELHLLVRTMQLVTPSFSKAEFVREAVEMHIKRVKKRNQPL